MTSSGDYNAPSAAVEAVLDGYGIFDAAQRRRIHREAQRRLEERATKSAVRVLIREALGQGWSPPPSASDAFEVPSDFPVPIRQEVYCRVVRWIRGAGEFGVRDLQRASDWFDRAIDARACLDGLVAQGEVEVVPPPLRWPCERGRPPGTRYRAVREPAAQVDAHEPKAMRDAAAEVEDLDWAAVLRSDEI